MLIQVLICETNRFVFYVYIAHTVLIYAIPAN